MGPDGIVVVPPVPVAVSVSPASSAARARADLGARRTLEGNIAGVPQAVRVGVGVAVARCTEVAVGVGGAIVGNGADDESGKVVDGSLGVDSRPAVGVATTMTGM